MVAEAPIIELRGRRTDQGSGFFVRLDPVSTSAIGSRITILTLAVSSNTSLIERHKIILRVVFEQCKRSA